jgi:divalent metal cation (Fe/Co/Zn/Cd) transporter
MGYNIARDAARELMDSCMDDAEACRIKEKALGVEGVKEIDDLRSRITGHQTFIDLQIAVDESITVKEGHDVAFRVKQKILEDPSIADVLVHVNPFTLKEGETAPQ